VNQTRGPQQNMVDNLTPRKGAKRCCRIRASSLADVSVLHRMQTPSISIA
jgi:hypothetical protein